ncbi:MAG: porin [Burkholderiales bacterium]|nr:porin [Burkholderiales bacterium]
MKPHHRTLAIAALCAAGGASAQSSVTVFGLIDLSYTHLKSSTAHVTQLAPDANTSSRIGFRGTEDLGGGMKAGFWIEAAIAPDDGEGAATNANNQGTGVGAATAGRQGLTFGRKSIVSLAGNWGEVRLGRDYTPTFLNLTTSMHPFGTNGVSSSLILFGPKAAGGTTARTNVRASNSFGYVLPETLGGFYGQAMYALGENASNSGVTADDGKYGGLRLGYKAGDLNLAAATGKTKYSTGDYTQSNAGINYQFGPAQLMYLWGSNKVGVTRTTAQMIGTQWRVGPGELRLAYTRVKASGVANDATQVALGYVYELSKRTAVYANYSQIRNKGVGTGYDVGIAATPGGTTKGYELGMRHSF